MSKESNTNTFPHQDLLKEKSVNVTDLPKKTQDLIAKFSALTDEDAQDAMDQKIFIQIEDHLEEKEKMEKEEKGKAKHAEAKSKKVDVSKAATAAPVETPEQIKAREEAEAAAKRKAEKPLTNFIFGRK